MSFEAEVRKLINRQSREDGSDTPDHILAQYLNECLVAFEIAVRQREVWHGRGSDYKKSE